MSHPYHPLADAYPLMNEADLDDLAASIKANGQRDPIWLLGEEILDGRNRELACKKARVKPVYEQYDGPDDEDSLRAFIEDRNEHRRHLTPDFLKDRREEKRKRIAERLKSDPEESDRQVGEAAGADHKTVGTVRSEMEGRGEIPHVETRKDSRGRKQPGKKRKKKPPAETGKNGHVEPTEPSPGSVETNGVLRDPLGLIVGEKQAAAFDPAHEKLRQEILTLCRQLTRALSDYASTPAGAFLAPELKRLARTEENIRYRDDGLESLFHRLKQLAPHCSRCPYCLTETDPKKSGRNCRCCRGLDWAPFRVFERSHALPAECREAVEALRKEAQG